MLIDQIHKQFNEVVTFLVWGLGLLFIAGCSLEGSVEYLNGGPSGGSIQGKALMFENSSSQMGLSNSILSMCSDKKVSIHKVKTDGTIDASFIAEVNIEADGSFQIPKANTYAISDNDVINYVLKASGCSEEFYRPVTGVDEQDISMGTTFLGFLPLVSDAGKTNLNAMTLSQASSVISALLNVNESNLSDSFDAIAADPVKKSAFEALTGTTMQRLREIPPTIVTTSLPTLIKEGQSNALSVSALHWDSSYQKAYQWSVDGVGLSTTTSLSWTLNKNSQGSHTVLLKIGSDNGSGGIDLSKPVYQNSMNLVVQNTFPAVPPAITVADYVNAVNLPIQINTGALKVNCETFSSMAIVEGYLPPAPSAFTRTCTTAGTQTETFTLSNTETTKQVALWVKDSSGNISVAYSGAFVSLDTTLPSASINDLTGVQGAGTSVDVHWSAADASGLSVLKLQYASDGTAFTDVVDLLTHSTTPYSWTVATDNVSAAKLRVFATDRAGNTSAATTAAFTIDATVPGPPTAILAGAPTLTNAAFDITVNFTEAVTGLLASDFTVTNGTASSLVTVSGGSYTLTITPSITAGNTGVTTVKLPSGTVQDLSTDPMVVDSNTLTINIDKVIPTVALTPVTANPANTDVTVTVDFSKSVTGFTASDVSVTNGSVSSVSGTGMSYTLVVANTITAQNSGTLSISVPAGGATDAAGNTNSATSSALTYTIDKVGPTVALTSGSASSVSSTFSVTATLGKASSNFALGDITVSGGTASNFASTSSTIYTFDVTPNAQATSPGTINVSVAAGTLTDSALGNTNTVSNTLTRTSTEITQNWNTTLTSSDGSILPVAGGVASLSSTNLTQTDFTAGTHVGTVGAAGKLTLSSTLPSPKELDSTWAPKWSNIVGYWKMNGDWLDASPSGNNGTASGGATFSTSAKLGAQTGNFNGSTGTVSIGNVGVSPTIGSISVWVNPSSISTTAIGMIFVGNSNNSSANRIYIAQAQTTGNFGVYLGTNSGPYDSGLIIPLSTWTQLTVTWNAGTYFMYMNGTQVKTGTYSGLTTMGAYASIGSWINTAGAGQTSFFHGRIDEAVVWSTALSASEISYLYQRQNPTSAQSELDSTWTPHWGNLVAYWHFNETSLTGGAGEIRDSVGSNHGTANNGATVTSAKLGSSALSLDGSDDYVSLATHTQSGSQVTVCAWVKPPSSLTGSIIYAERSTTNQGPISAQLYHVNGQVRFITRDNSSGNTSTAAGGMLLPGQWNHVCGSRNVGTNSVYLNGSVAGRSTGAGGTITTDNTTIGAFYQAGTGIGVGTRFNGGLDDLAVWNTTLSDSDILYIYSKQNSKFGGSYLSPISTVSSTSSFSFFKWVSLLPFLKELPGDTNADATPDSESSADYSGISAGLNTGLVGLWHLNETTVGTAGGGTADFADSSGKGNHGTASGSPTFGATGVFNKAVTFNGTTSGIAISNSASLNPTSQVTLSAWINLSSLSNSYPMIVTKGTSQWNLRLKTNTRVVQFCNDTDCVYGPTLLDASRWYLVTATHDGTNMKIYLNGKLENTFSGATALASSTSTVYIGRRTDGYYFPGTIDEVAIWNRALTDGTSGTPNEILELYRRGANRNKLQFRTCTQSDCSDKTDADWVGPDKTASSWFSELHNMAAVASTGDGSGIINLTAPILDFSKWIAAVSGWTFAPTPARYFQYRALMESDDVNNLCLDGASAATPCMPDITSVTPTAELSPAPYITSATGTSFYTTISSLSFTVSGTCASDSTYPVKFQLSKDGGSTYQYYNGTAWVTATAGSYSTASTQAQITAGLSTFTCSSAPCTLMVRSYPGTNAANSCNISAPVISVNRF